MSSAISGKSVYVLEDHDDVREEVCQAYLDLGLNVLGQSKQFQEGMTKIHELEPDLISLDIIMPDYHGLECYQRLKQKYPSKKIVFVSFICKDHLFGRSFIESISSDLFIPKPIDLNEMRGALEKIFS